MKIHFIGIGGIGISALAQYYLVKGHQVSGSDLNSSETTDFLKEKGAKLLIGVHKAENIPENIDLVIYSPAVQPGNPELKEAQVTNIQTLSYPQALGKLTKEYITIAVSGTHGKSTVTAMISLILIKAGFDPTVILGTKLKEFGNGNFRQGESKYLIIEADEWQASFLNYWPKIIVLTNIEKEHLDYYKNLNHILKTYKKYLSHLPEDGFLITNKDDKNIKNLIQKFLAESSPSVNSGQVPLVVKNVIYFSKNQKEKEKLKKILKIPGEHNISNSLAVLTVARILKIPDKISFKALSEYRGAWRRFEISAAELHGTKPACAEDSMGRHGTTRKITIVSDYGHHPTEILATLKAAKEKFKDKKIFLVFQPHQYQRTFYLFQDFLKVFKKINIAKTIITDIFDVPGRENQKIKKKVNSKKLVRVINNPEIIYLPKNEISLYLKKNLKGEEVVIIMGAGDIYKLAEKF